MRFLLFAFCFSLMPLFVFAKGYSSALLELAKKGNAEAQFELASCYESGDGVKKSPIYAFDWYKSSAKKGNAKAQYRMGIYYYQGDGVPKSFKEGTKWFRRSAKQGYSKAQYKMARAYFCGFGVKKNPKEAFKWLSLSAEQGYSPAQRDLGYFYLDGIGVEKNSAEGVKYFKKSADQGDIDAIGYLAQCYFAGEGVEKNTTEAVRLFRIAADKGCKESQFCLAICYDKGEGVPKDIRQAMKWYRKAADQGLSMAQLNLGVCYGSGEAGSKNYAEALKWFWKAARQSNGEALHNLSYYYYKGYGVSKNILKAYALEAISFAFYKHSPTYLIELKQKMTPEQRKQEKAAIKAMQKELPNANFEINLDVEMIVSKTGSGFAITKVGHIVTNYHVIKDAQKIEVVKGDKKIKAELVAFSKENDLAILKIKSNTKPLPLISSSKVKLGAQVYTIGFPNVYKQGYSPKFTSGEISSINGFRDDPKSFQVSAPIFSGSSGGALVDARCNLIGVVCAGLASSETINYAVKSSLLEKLIESNSSINESRVAPNKRKLSSETIASRLNAASYFILVEVPMSVVENNKK